MGLQKATIRCDGYSGSHIFEGFLEEEATSRAAHGGEVACWEKEPPWKRLLPRYLRKTEWHVLCHVGHMEG